MSTQVAGFYDGTFAQFVRVDGKNFFRIPEEVSFDNAASYGVAFQTTSLGLYQKLRLPEPYGARDEEATPILVWGGASRCLQIFADDTFAEAWVGSVGMVVIQLAKLSGLTVITTAS